MLSCSAVQLAQHREALATRFDGLFGCCSSTRLQLAKSLATDEQARLVQIRHFSCDREPTASAPSPDASPPPAVVRERIHTDAATVLKPPEQQPRSVSHGERSGSHRTGPCDMPETRSPVQSAGPGASEMTAANNIIQADAGIAPDAAYLKVTTASSAVKADAASAPVQSAAAPPATIGDAPDAGLPAAKDMLEGEPEVEQVQMEQQLPAEVGEVQLTKELPTPVESETATAKFSDVDWGSGAVRVLLATGSNSESSKRIEQWCRTCDISDVTILSFEGCTAADADRRLGQSAAALSKRCQPGDTVFLSIAGLGDSALEDSIIGISLAYQLPSMVTIVCIADSRASLLLLGLDQESVAAVQDKCLRVVAMLLVQECSASPCAAASAAQADFSARAMLRAADALSLSDGPCSLSCRDFFQEMSDQASELAARTRVALPHTELMFHRTSAQGAGEAEGLNEAFDGAAIRWPLAAAPRNQADGAGYTELSTESAPFPPVLEPGVMDAGKFDLVPPEGLNDPPQRRSSQARGAPSCYPAGRRSYGSDPRAPLLGRRKSDGTEREPRPRSSNRAMPTDLSGLSMMLTGGRLKGQPRSGSAGAPRSGSAGAAGVPGKDGVPAASVRRRSARNRRSSRQQDVEKSSKELESANNFQKLSKELEDSNEVLE